MCTFWTSWTLISTSKTLLVTFVRSKVIYGMHRFSLGIKYCFCNIKYKKDWVKIMLVLKCLECFCLFTMVKRRYSVNVNHQANNNCMSSNLYLTLWWEFISCLNFTPFFNHDVFVPKRVLMLQMAFQQITAQPYFFWISHATIVWFCYLARFIWIT